MKTIKLLLTETIDNLGIVGDVVDVKPGYARNFLLPRGMATEPTQENVAAYAEQRKRVQEELARQRAVLEKDLERLSGFQIELERSANEQGVLYGGVSQHEIGELLRNEGFAIEDRMVRIGDQIKRVDSYEIPLQLAPDLKTSITLNIKSDQPLDLDEEEEAEAETEEARAGEPVEAEPGETTETATAE